MTPYQYNLQKPQKLLLRPPKILKNSLKKPTKNPYKTLKKFKKPLKISKNNKKKPKKM
jgi:hypothetical protein